MSRYVELNIPTDSSVPEGYRLILAYAKGDRVRIPMDPSGLVDGYHSCDWEGCSSVAHCLSISPQQKYMLERAALNPRGGGTNV